MVLGFLAAVLVVLLCIIVEGGGVWTLNVFSENVVEYLTVPAPASILRV